MSILKMKTIREFNGADLNDRLQQSRIELVKLQVELTKGTLKKNSGKIKPLKKEIARLITRMNYLKHK